MRLWAETFARAAGAESDIRMGGMHVFGFRAQCPVCGEPPEGETVKCATCGTPHHRDCWSYAGRCALYACEPRPERRPGAAAPRFEEDPGGWLVHLLRPRNPERALVSFNAMLAMGTSVFVCVSLVLMYGYCLLVRSAEAEAHARTLGLASSAVHARHPRL